MDNDTKTEENKNISKDNNDNIKESDAVEEQALGKNESESKMLSIYSKLMLRLCLVSTGLMIFLFAFLKAVKITGFDATKLILLEICLLVLFVFIVGIAVALTKMRHESRVKNSISVLIYVSAFIVMVSLLLVWAFFKATPV